MQMLIFAWPSSLFEHTKADVCKAIPKDLVMCSCSRTSLELLAVVQSEMLSAMADSSGRNNAEATHNCFEPVALRFVTRRTLNRTVCEG